MTRPRATATPSMPPRTESGATAHRRDRGRRHPGCPRPSTRRLDRRSSRRRATATPSMPLRDRERCADSAPSRPWTKTSRVPGAVEAGGRATRQASSERLPSGPGPGHTTSGPHGAVSALNHDVEFTPDPDGSQLRDGDAAERLLIAPTGPRCTGDATLRRRVGGHDIGVPSPAEASTGATSDERPVVVRPQSGVEPRCAAVEIDRLDVHRAIAAVFRYRWRCATHGTPCRPVQMGS